MADESSTEPETSHLDPAARRVGSVLDGKWTLSRLLGVGGMAAVYAATHRNGARAAIKLFPFSVTTSAEFAERILREGYLANKIGHPAVVRVLDDHLDREREYAYLVMELLEGETARQLVERTGPMSPLDAVGYMLELCDCLSAAHDKGVVHRDIKPENLFVTSEARLKVLDFGVARALDGTSSSVTRTGAMLGTPAYMSPEQARGRPSEISPRSDIYSAGATLLFLVSGDFMHEGESAQEIMVRAAWTPARKVRDRGLGLPDQIADMIDKACEFDPKDRYVTAAEMHRDLTLAKAVLAGTPSAREPIVRVRRPLPTATVPLELHRPRDAAETLQDRTPPPDAASVPGGRRATPRAPLWIGAALTVAATASAVALWPRDVPPEEPASASAREPTASGARAPTPSPAVPEPEPAATAAPAPEPSAAPETKPRAPASSSARPHAHTPAPKPRASPPAPPATSRESSGGVVAAPSRAGASKASPDRDVGY